MNQFHETNFDVRVYVHELQDLQVPQIEGAIPIKVAVNILAKEILDWPNEDDNLSGDTAESNLLEDLIADLIEVREAVNPGIAINSGQYALFRRSFRLAWELNGSRCSLETSELLAIATFLNSCRSD